MTYLNKRMELQKEVAEAWGNYIRTSDIFSENHNLSLKKAMENYLGTIYRLWQIEHNNYMEFTLNIIKFNINLYTEVV